MMLVHLEHVVGRRQDHLIVLGQHHGLQDVDRLGDVGHLDPLAVLVEYVQRRARHQRIAQ